jgi:hypothetical protein
MALDIIKLVVGPFFLKMLPDIFDFLDQHKADSVEINIHTEKIDYFDMKSGTLVFSENFDNFKDIEGKVSLGIDMSVKLALKTLKTIMVERYELRTVVLINTGSLGIVDLEYKNEHVWKLQTKLLAKKSEQNQPQANLPE